MNWLYFPIFFFISAILWIMSFVLLFNKNNKRVNTTAIFLSIAGTLCITVFTFILWVKTGRPPMRTLGETRLWYSLFLSLIGILIFFKWKYKWFLQYSIMMALVFLTINYFRPETYNKTLMPALQSVWFVPHVIVYIFSYALLAAASLASIKALYMLQKKTFKDDILILTDNLTNIGFAFLTLGLVFGALWAKEAWGDYWTWDPKETWALITWLAYLVYIHLRYRHPNKYKSALLVLSLSFVFILFCWFLVNYLPTAQNSVHTYTN